jgi:hypothetical protein
VSRISSRSDGAGNAGTILVSAARHLLVARGGISGNTFGTGSAGDVFVTASAIELSNRAGISSDTLGPGPAGDVHVRADSLRLVGNGVRGQVPFIASEAGMGSGGNAGTVTVEVTGAVELLGSARIATSTFGSGEAGNITLRAGSLLIEGNSPRVYTGINSRNDARGIGSGGTITVDVAGPIEVRGRGSQISSTSLGSGTGGDVSVRASHLKVRNGGEISSSGLGLFGGSGGNVFLMADILVVEDGSILTAGTGSGGRIDITAGDLAYLRNAVMASAGVEPVPGTSIIRLRTPLLVVNGSLVAVFTGTGQPLAGIGTVMLLGNVTIVSADSFVPVRSNVDVGSQLAVPQSVFLDAGHLLQENCAARRSETTSSFTAMGRGGLPPDPAKPIPGSYADLGGRPAANQAGSVLASSFGEGCRAAPDG